MAKGRKLTISRSERYLGSLSYDQGQGPAAASPEFGEDEVWSVVDDDPAAGEEWTPRASNHSNGSLSGYGAWRPPPLPDRRRSPGGLSLAFEDGAGGASSPRIVHQIRQESPRGRHLAASAPVDVPDWSKIYRVDSVESLPDWDDGVDESELVPPHEYLARSRKMAANSVFEGVGRTLKGRDLSRVRDAVWSQTGFDG
ncbi:hypothetical protein STAS_23536 [Striga asiatica]|uniref:Senescence regulator n=1 Tax=Striga asiatica TaxID=4170 RepID=A0A5A7QMV6_STRAF|nr:hypothetical protein STAS_23536 [Striga asiatica]